MLVIEFHDFKDQAGNLIFKDYTITKTIPNQLDEETASIIETIGKYVGITMSVHYLFTVLKKSGVGALVASIKALQIITHLSLMPVIISADAMIFFSYICNAVSFDPIDIQEWVEGFFDLQ